MKTKSTEFATFRGVAVRRGQFWTAGTTQRVYGNDEDGVIIDMRQNEQGEKMLVMTDSDECWMMREDGEPLIK